MNRPPLLAMAVMAPLLPFQPAHVLPFVLAGTAVMLYACHLDRAKVAVPLTGRAAALIALNLMLSAAYGHAFLWWAGPVPGAMAPGRQWLWLPVWAAVDEALFYAGHRCMHSVPCLYRHVHKLHHQFTITSAWTSFYGHPLDIAFVMAAAYAGPLATTAVTGTPLPAPVIAAYMWGAVCTFVRSHHTTTVTIRAAGHHAHHAQFTVNYGNFTWGLDQALGTRAPAL